MQPPCGLFLRQGICDFCQIRGIGNAGEAVVLFGECYAGLLRLTGDIFVTIENDLRPEWRVTTHFDRHVTPVRVPDMKGIMIDIRPRILRHELTELSRARHLHLPNRRRCFGDKNQENSRFGLLNSEMFLGHFVLVLAGRTVDHRDVIVFRPSPQAAAETSVHAHQMIVIQILVGPV